MQGYIVPNGVVYGGYEPGFGYRVSVLHDPDGLNPITSPYTQFWLAPVGRTQPSGPANIFSFSELADIQVRVFFVSLNDPISLSPLIAGDYAELTYNWSATTLVQISC